MADIATVRPEVADSDEEFHRLVTLLDEQRAAMLELEALGRDRRALVSACDGEALLALLARRQGVIERLGRAAEAGRRVREAWEQGTPATWRVREVRRRIEELIAAQARLEKADADDAALLVATREQMARELADLATGQRAVRAYAPGRSDGARYQDAKG
ncbi:MAG: hypothetical protein HBSAPP03_00690 [Phycisphaerae bacterium]|nr:MAG: hypothetical protein HBSAPP03_00690 [Phycisphaerae bacterium]